MLGEIYKAPNTQENEDILRDEDDDNFPSLSRLTDLASHIGALGMATLPEKSRILSQHQIQLFDNEVQEESKIKDWNERKIQESQKFQSVQTKIFEQISQNQNLSKLDQQQQDSVKGIISELISSTLNESMKVQREEEPQSPPADDGRNDKLNSQQSQSRSSITNSFGVDINQSQISIEAQQSTTPPEKSTARSASPNNNIYGTKDYYDYYTRLQPQLRNPKLPKPTYIQEPSVAVSPQPRN